MVFLISFFPVRGRRSLGSPDSDDAASLDDRNRDLCSGSEEADSIESIRHSGSAKNNGTLLLALVLHLTRHAQGAAYSHPNRPQSTDLELHVKSMAVESRPISHAFLVHPISKIVNLKLPRIIFFNAPMLPTPPRPGLSLAIISYKRSE